MCCSETPRALLLFTEDDHRQSCCRDRLLTAEGTMVKASNRRRKYHSRVRAFGAEDFSIWVTQPCFMNSRDTMN